MSEHLLLSTSEQLISLGLRDLGYQYVVLDDCWQQESGRDQHGKLQPEPSKFPHGLKSISDRLHEKGLKFGMYSSAGEMTCARYGMSLKPSHSRPLTNRYQSQPDRLTMR